MENQSSNGIVVLVSFLTAIGLGVLADKIDRHINQKERQKKVDNTPVKITTSFVVPEASADLVHVSKEALLGKHKLSETELQEFKSFMSSAGGQVLQAALTAKGTADLLKCNIPISELYKINGNPDQLRAFVLKDGKFDQQAILSPAGLKSIAPLLVFQCMAAVTSQYYQQVITERLDEINDKLDRLMQRIEIQDRAKMQSCYLAVAELYNKSLYDMADKTRADRCHDDLCALLLQYRELVKAVPPSKLKISSKITDYAEARAKVKALEDSHYFIHLEDALCAETLLLFANVVRWQIAKFNKNEKEMNNMAKSLEFNIMKNYATSFAGIKHDVLGYIDECWKEATLKREEIQNLRVETEKRFRMAEQQIIQTANVLNPNLTTYFRFLPDGESEVYVDVVEVK